MRYSDNIQNQALRSLEARLPSEWRLKRATRDRKGRTEPDVIAELKAPDGKTVRLVMDLKNRMEPRDVETIAGQIDEPGGRTGHALSLVVSSFLTPRTRELLKEAGLSYLDLTGNCWIVSSSPGLFIYTTGLEKNPQAEGRPARSLKGSIAGRTVRALCDFFPPVGVRELAGRIEADPGYVSRLLAFLDREALIVRKGRGTVQEVKWKALIARWAQDYSPFTEERILQCLEPRGLDALSGKLRKFEGRYALTASTAASAVAPIAPARLVTCYVDDPEAAAHTLGLRPAESGINVRLVTPFDAVVYERTWNQDDLTYAALSQVAADLLRSPGRGPEEAAALLDWMALNEDDWRT